MKRAMIFTLIVGVFSLIGCSYTPSSTEKLQIVTSFYPLYYFTSQITGTKAEVINITPAGVEPHDFEPTARDIAHIQDSKLLVVNGLGFEPWADKVTAEVEKKGVKVVNSGRTLEQLGAHSDPHIWLNPFFALTQVVMIREALIEIDPAHKDIYQQNADNLFKNLSELDTEYRAGLSGCQRKTIITSHAAFGHLAREYGLEQKSIAGLSPDAEPSARELAELAKFAKDNQVKYIFFESLVSPKLAETLAHETGAQTLVLNPLEGLTDEEMKEGKDYFSVMRENLKNLRIALDCK